MSKTFIKTCTCNHKYQDSKYGKKKRVHNEMVNGYYRCTVCSDKKKD